MRKIFLILLVIFFAECEKDEVQTETTKIVETEKDCKCWRVTKSFETKSYDFWNADVWAINECTGEEKYFFVRYSREKKVGTCYFY